MGRAASLRFTPGCLHSRVERSRVERLVDVAKREFLCGKFLQAAAFHRPPNLMDRSNRPTRMTGSRLFPGGEVFFRTVRP